VGQEPWHPNYPTPAQPLPWPLPPRAAYHSEECWLTLPIGRQSTQQRTAWTHTSPGTIYFWPSQARVCKERHSCQALPSHCSIKGHVRNWVLSELRSPGLEGTSFSRFTRQGLSGIWGKSAHCLWSACAESRNTVVLAVVCIRGSWG